MRDIPLSMVAGFDVVPKARLEFSEWAGATRDTDVGGGLIRKAQHVTSVDTNIKFGAVDDSQIFLNMLEDFGRIANRLLAPKTEQVRAEIADSLLAIQEYVLCLATSYRLDMETLVKEGICVRQRTKS